LVETVEVISNTITNIQVKKAFETQSQPEALPVMHPNQDADSLFNNNLDVNLVSRGYILSAMKAILHSRICWLAFVTSLNPFSSALAEKPVDLHFIGGMSLGYSNFDFPAKLDHDLTFPVYQINGAVAYKKFYAVVNLADSLSDADVSEEEDVGDASRYDRDISLGYQVTANWGVFVGYKTGKTTIDYQTREDLDNGQAAPTRKESYKQEGPFVGVSYAVKFSRAGKLALSLAYADLDATNKFTRDIESGDNGTPELEFDDLTGTVKGKSKGLSYGIRWSIPVSGNLLYYASFKINDYKQDLTVDGKNYDNIDQTITYLTTGIIFVY
jgi:hypothetical protein